MWFRKKKEPPPPPPPPTDPEWPKLVLDNGHPSEDRFVYVHHGGTQTFQFDTTEHQYRNVRGQFKTFTHNGLIGPYHLVDGDSLTITGSHAAVQAAIKQIYAQLEK